MVLDSYNYKKKTESCPFQTQLELLFPVRFNMQHMRYKLYMKQAPTVDLNQGFAMYYG